MDIRQLKYFVTIAEEGKITAAAKQLHIAQPPLSRQLKQLEEELGVVLFDRNKKKSLTLTYEGEVFYKRAKDILHKLRFSKCRNCARKSPERLPSAQRSTVPRFCCQKCRRSERNIPACCLIFGRESPHGFTNCWKTGRLTRLLRQLLFTAKTSNRKVFPTSPASLSFREINHTASAGKPT